MKTENHNLTQHQVYNIFNKYNADFYYSNILEVWVYKNMHFDNKTELLNYLIEIENINQ